VPLNPEERRKVIEAVHALLPVSAGNKQDQDGKPAKKPRSAGGGSPTPRLHTIALGCQMSAADGSECRRAGQGGFAHHDVPREPTPCSFPPARCASTPRTARSRSSARCARGKRRTPSRVLIVSGCAANASTAGFRETIPYVDLVVGAKSIDRFDALVSEAIGERFDASKKARGLRLDAHRLHGDGLRDDHAGCNYSARTASCPRARRELYRPVEDVLATSPAKSPAARAKSCCWARP